MGRVGKGGATLSLIIKQTNSYQSIFLSTPTPQLAKARGFTPTGTSDGSTDAGVDEEGKDVDVLTAAFIGLPNVGKSSILNALLHGPSPSAAFAAMAGGGAGEEEEEGRYPRLIASEVAGTTRDAVLVDYEVCACTDWLTDLIACSGYALIWPCV